MSTEPLEKPEEEPVEVDPAVLEQAREYGYRSPEEWLGEPPPGGLLSPDEYLEKPYVQAKIAQKRVTDLEAKLEEKDRDFDERTARMERMQQETLARTRDAHKRELEAISQERRQAAQDGDMDRFDDLDKRYAEMAKEPEKPDGPSPAMKAWGAKNPWFNEDPDARSLAISVAQRVADAKGDEQAQMAAVDRVVRQRFPEHFEQPKPKVARVDGGGLGGLAGKTLFDKLPPEAQRQARIDVEDGLYENAEAWAKVYLQEFPDG